MALLLGTSKEAEPKGLVVFQAITGPFPNCRRNAGVVFAAWAGAAEGLGRAGLRERALFPGRWDGSPSHGVCFVLVFVPQLRLRTLSWEEVL